MQHHIEQATPFLKGESILAQQIEHKTIGHNTVRAHRTTLIIVIKTLI